MSEVADTQTVADIPRHQAAQRPDADALIFGDRATTWAELDTRSNRVANALVAAGLEPGARVAILDKDSDHLWEAVFGIAKAGSVVMGINWRLAPKEIGFILEDGEARALFVGAEHAGKLGDLRASHPSLETVVVLSGEHPMGPEYTTWRDASPASDPRLPTDPEDVVAQMYTSGTTGLPKGVMLANRSFFAVVRSMREVGDSWIGWTPDDVSLMGIPSFHIGGIWWAMTGMNAGAAQVVIDTFVAWQALELVPRHGVTKTCMVPAMIQVLLAEPSCAQTDFSTLGCIVYGGSPIPLPFLKQAMARFGCDFAQIYGLTETGNTAVCLRPDDHRTEDAELLKAAGRPYPGVTAKVIDEAGKPLPAGEIGEICLHSPANMVGYWNRPEATASTLIDGWVHTGDAGYLDARGYVFVCDRKKDMIIYAGENVYPAEIESVLCDHPAVLEAAVIGVPDDRWGELVKAIVVLKPDQKAKGPHLIAHCRGQLADFKVPKSVTFIDSLPRTPSGKIKKAELRKPYWEGRDRQVN